MRLFESYAGILLLIGLCKHQIDAFGTPLKVRSATFFPSTRQNIGESDFSRASDGIIGPRTEEIVPNDGEAIFKAVNSSISKNDSSSKRLIWVCFILMFANFSTDIQRFSNIPQNVASAAVTSSFIRGSRSTNRISVKQLAFAALLGWQLIPQVGKLIVSAANIVSRCTNLYVGSLEAFPLITKACSAGVIGFLGDICAQQFEERTRVKREGPAASPIKYDVRRGLSTVADGLLVTGPILHFVYDFLENLIPISGSALPPSLAAISQVLLDDIFVDALFVATTFIFTGISEGYGKRTLTQFKTDFFPTVRAGWAASLMLMPLEFTCFRFLPVSFRVLGMNFVDIVWDGVLSFQVHKSRIRMKREAAEATKLADQGSRGEEPAEGLSYAM